MALARVQAAPKATGGSTTSIAIPFSTPPTVANGIIVLVIGWGTSSSGNVAFPGSCVDNRGNAYTLAKWQQQPGGTPAVWVFYCPAITASGTPFTVTMTSSGTGYWLATAIEVSGVGPGLQIDQSASTQAVSGTTPTTGTTAALTAAEVFAVAVVALGSGQASCTVQSVTPPWTQEVEDLSFSWSVGEGDSRVLTGVTGTTQSCGWTIASSISWAAAIVCFATPAALVAEQVQTYVLLPV